MGKAQQLSVENCNHSVILAESKESIEVVNSDNLTLVAGGTRNSIIKVQDSREISVIAHLDAMRDPLETHGCTGVTLFAVQDVPPNVSPE